MGLPEDAVLAVAVGGRQAQEQVQEPREERGETVEPQPGPQVIGGIR